MDALKERLEAKREAKRLAKMAAAATRDDGAQKKIKGESVIAGGVVAYSDSDSSDSSDDGEEVFVDWRAKAVK